MNTPEQQLSESLLAACKAAGIKEPKYIAQDKSGAIYHYSAKPNMIRYAWIHGDNVVEFDILYHPPYATDWRDSLLEWVDPQEMLPTVFIPHEGEPLADVLARHPDHVADDSKMVSDDARKLGYRRMIAEYAGRRTEAQVYEIAWQDALAWKGGGDD
jgi:hypothetical protein